MAKDKTLYTCNACGATSPRWLGKCPGCGAWNSLEETVAEPTAAAGGKNRLGGERSKHDGKYGGGFIHAELYGGQKMTIA